jgi:flagellum-specific peptidoglycan hydrolase FlgJ
VLVRAWQALWKETPSRQAILVLLAQGAFETGWWKACRCWNLGNAKSVLGDGHCYTYFACTEIVNGKVVKFQPPHPATRFRAFRTVGEGAVDYLTLLRKRFSKAWPCVLAGDPAGFARALKDQGYYTDTLAHYTAQVLAIFRKLDKDFRDFDPNAIVQADILTEQERERVQAQVALSLAELTRKLLDENHRDDKPEGLA